MRALLLILLFTVLASETCQEKKERKKAAAEAQSKPGDMAKIPACIQSRIDSIKKLPRFNPPAEVTEYSFYEKRVFLFSADCCDMYNSVYDENCQYVCAPTGGITGQGDMKCKDFSKNANLVKVIWKDERK